MVADGNEITPASGLPEIVRKVRARTPARLMVGRTGGAYRTNTELDLLKAQAAARDAVRAELSLEDVFPAEFVEKWNLFQIWTKVKSKDEYLLRPDLGRAFDNATRDEIRQRCSANVDFQIVIGDGLSVSAVGAQVPALVPVLCEGAKKRGWKIGEIFAIRHCRVGILNEIGEVLKPRVAVLLIGERPGLSTAESLSAYMAYEPKASQTDANRNLVSNIYARGLSASEAAARILNFAEQMITSRMSGYLLKGERPALSG
jgi:ethanolamine ammonia-lyase small subunit